MKNKIYGVSEKHLYVAYVNSHIIKGLACFCDLLLFPDGFCLYVMHIVQNLNLYKPQMFQKLHPIWMGDRQMYYKTYMTTKIQMFSTGEKNYLRKEFIQRLNRITQIVGFAIAESPSKEISGQEVRQLIMIKLLLSPTTVKRYFDQMISLGIFQYDGYHDRFRFPEDVVFSEEQMIADSRESETVDE